MRLGLTLTAFLAACSLLGCSSTPASSYSNNSGAVAMSRDDGLVYAADSDNDALYVVDARTREKVAELKTGRAPEHVVVGPDDTIYVSNRQGRSISVFKKGQWEGASATVNVGVEPYAMAFTQDGKTLLVVNSTTLESASEGSLMAIDTGSLQPTWEVVVGDEPRGVAVVNDNAALVSLSRKGELVRVNLETHKVDGNVTVNGEANKTPPPNPDVFEPQFKESSTFKARSALELAATPDGTRVVSTVTWSSDAVLEDGDPKSTIDTGGGSTYGSIGGCSSTSVATAGTFTVEAHGLKPLVDALSSCGGDPTLDYPPTILRDRGNVPVQGPGPIVVDPSGQWVFVADRQTNDVSIMAAGYRDVNGFGGTVTQTVPVPAGPVGLAVSRDGRTAWVYSLFAHQLVSISARSEASRPVLETSEPIQLGAELLSPSAAAGRELFFSAVDSRMNTIGIACGTCHVDGREDGHVWMFNDGPRQTPSLAGRKLRQTAPYHWNGVFSNFDEFASHTIARRMGGTGITPDMENQLLDFIDTVKAPDNANKHDQMTDAQLRGQQVFQKAECGSCHAGETLTDNRMVSVGTEVSTGPVRDAFPQGMNTPSLLGVARTAPFLHDGSAQTIEDRLMMNKAADLHGKTSQLTTAEISDLAAYVNSL